MCCVGEYIECKREHDVNNIKFIDIYLKSLEYVCFLLTIYGNILAECGGDVKWQVLPFAHFKTGVL
jgi:hypothetical protein